MPTFMTGRIARSLYRRPQPQTQGQPPVPPVTYGREFFAESDTFTKRAETLRDIGVEAPVLVVGCGVGLLNEELTALGIASYGIEPSSWCWAQMRRTPPSLIDDDWTGMSESQHPAERGIIEDWVGSGQTMSLLAQGGMPTHFPYVVDEDACPAHSDEELPVFMAGLEGLGDHVVHLVTTMDIAHGPGDSSQNWKTLKDWRKLAPTHTWIDLRHL